MDPKKYKSVMMDIGRYKKLNIISKKKFEIPISKAKMIQFIIDKEYEKFVIDRTGLTSKELPSLTKPKPVTPENIQIISDDELRNRFIDGTLDDPKLETTLFPNGKPSK